MNGLLRLPSSYLGLPLLLACGMTVLTYRLPTGYLSGILLLAMAAAGITAFDVLSGLRLPPFERIHACRCAGSREAILALALAALVASACLVDLTLFSVPLFDRPSAYADMSGGRVYVRHVSDMCWALAPIGMLCVRKKWLRNILVGVALVFPVLVIDRNRLMASAFSVAMVLVLRRKAGKPLPWKAVGFLLLSGLGLFSLLGIIRSGSLDAVSLPFSAVYRNAPAGVKWLLLYASAGPYNFGAMVAKHYIDAHFLVNQVVPMSGSIETAGTNIPLDAPSINVGTEFFPFLLALGPLGAVCAIVVLYAMLRWSVRRLRAGSSLFALLIFLRVAYVCVMSPFAPQAYTWTNAGFIGICLLLQTFAAWLPNRKTSSPATAGIAHALPPQSKT